MILWTIHSIEVFDLLNKQGYYHGSCEHIDNYFLYAYDWMKKQLAIKTGINKEYHPVWAWTKRPDLRRCGYLEKGKKGVLIEFEIDKREVLISDFDLWHYVLNYWYLPNSMEDGDKFEEELKSKGMSYYKQKPLPEPYDIIIENSWLKIFDLDWCAEDITSKQDDKIFQAVFWELKLEQIKNIRKFTAK